MVNYTNIRIQKRYNTNKCNINKKEILKEQKNNNDDINIDIYENKENNVIEEFIKKGIGNTNPCTYNDIKTIKLNDIICEYIRNNIILYNTNNIHKNINDIVNKIKIMKFINIIYIYIKHLVIH
jgi:hypothetical protein